MRLTLIALLTLPLLVGPLAQAEAREKPGQAQAQRPAAAARPAAQRPGQNPSQAHAAAARRGVAQAAVQRSAPLRGQLAVTRDARAASSAACGPRRGAAQCRPAKMSWTRGLPPAAGTQANECPDGTMATLARGHEDIVRCMPI